MMAHAIRHPMLCTSEPTTGNAIMKPMLMTTEQTAMARVSRRRNHFPPSRD